MLASFTTLTVCFAVESKVVVANETMQKEETLTDRPTCSEFECRFWVLRVTPAWVLLISFGPPVFTLFKNKIDINSMICVSENNALTGCSGIDSGAAVCFVDENLR